MKNLVFLLWIFLSIAICKSLIKVNNAEAQNINSAQSSNKKVVSPDDVLAYIDNNARDFLEDSRMTSVSIGIYLGGETYIRHYGELDRSKGNTPTNKTIYEIASVTKTMTGMLVAQAVLDEKLSLTSDIRDFLDGDYSNLTYDNQPIQIKHLLTHTSRLPGNIPGVTELYNNKKERTMLEVEELYKKHSKEKLLEELKTVELDKLPGTAYTYSNIAPELLAHILENIYKKPFEQLLKEMVFDKAGMSNTCIHLTEKNLQYFTPGYNGKDLKMDLFQEAHWGAAGGVKTTLPDLVNYMKLQLNENDPLVAESHRKIMKGGRTNWRSYFWSIVNIGEGDFYSHNGYGPGTQNLFRVYPQFDMGISVVTNASFDGLPGIIRETVLNLVDDLKPIGKKSIRRAIEKKCLADVDEGIAFYHQLKKENPALYKFESEEELNDMGYILLADDKVESAIKIFQLLVAEFPNASNPRDSLGEAYYINKQYDLSLKSYQKALELEPDYPNAKGARKVIEEIMEK